MSGHGVDAGWCGAAPLAALHAVREKLDATATVVLLITEGPDANPVT